MAKKSEERKRRPCPMCGQPAVHRYRPFCSRRCADIDLGRWLSGAYAIPEVEDPEGLDEPEFSDFDRDDTPDTLH